MITGKNYVGNDLVAEGDVQFKTFNPVLGVENEWNFIEATIEEVNTASEKAYKAFKSYRKTLKEERATFLETIATEIKKIKKELIHVYMIESGLTKSRAEAELTRTFFQLTSFADFIRNNEIIESKNDGSDLIKKYIPIGPVVVFGASNFPFAYSTVGGDTVSALAAGCPVIVKSHPMHAGTGEMVASAVLKAVIKCKMPDGVFSNLNGVNHDVGVSLIKNKRIKGVGFTGSLKGGRAIFDIANQREEPIPVFAEMGSINPIIITNQTLKVKANFWVDKIGDSMLQSAGQFCTSPGLILAVASPELNEFKQKLAKKLNASDPETMLGRSIKSSFLSQKDKVTQQKGVSVLTKSYSDNALLSQPTVAVVDSEKFKINDVLQEEVFGSFVLIVSCKNEADLLETIEGLNGQLTGTFICEKEELEQNIEIIDSLQNRVGRLIFNGVPTGVQVTKNMSHGGPYPASTDARYTAVGTDSILRWLRPICFQNIDPKDLNRII